MDFVIPIKVHRCSGCVLIALEETRSLHASTKSHMDDAALAPALSIFDLC